MRDLDYSCDSWPPAAAAERPASRDKMPFGYGPLTRAERLVLALAYLERGIFCGACTSAARGRRRHAAETLERVGLLRLAADGHGGVDATARSLGSYDVTEAGATAITVDAVRRIVGDV